MIRRFFIRYGLLFVVFVGGACVLVIEVLATRILSSFFGNTIYSVSSVLSVILAALSVGYYSGGILADRRPKIEFLFGLIFFGGLSVLFLEVLMMIALPSLGSSLSIRTGPLISSLALFFIPAVFLGMLSPFVIKLREQQFPGSGIGRISGEVFFWSTIGSIFGSVLCGFYLVPNFGQGEIIVGVSFVLCLVGVSGLLLCRRLSVSKVLFGSLILGYGFFLLQDFSLKSDTAILYDKNGLYQRIRVYDKITGKRMTRRLRLDQSHSGGIYLDSGEALYRYAKYYRLHKLFVPRLQRALVIGGGMYAIPHALIKENKKVIVDVTEIESSLVEVSQKYFNLPKDSRLRHFAADGRRFLVDNMQEYDLIFCDAYYSRFSVPVHFTTKEFFELSRKRLSEQGLFIGNFFGQLSSERPSFIFSLIRTFREVFPHSYFFASISPKHPGIQNIIFVAQREKAPGKNPRFDFKSNAIVGHQDSFIRSLSKKLLEVQQSELSSELLFTDNYAPVESLTAAFL